MDKAVNERERVIRMPQYFTNLKNPREGDAVTLRELELHRPEGFLKHLDSMEKHQLLEEQLAGYGLKQGCISYEGCSELIKTQKKPEPLKACASTSNRLKEYLMLFEAEQVKNKYRDKIGTARCMADKGINRGTVIRLCRPALDYLKENADPYVTIHINSDRIEVTRTICGIPEKAVSHKG